MSIVGSHGITDALDLVQFYSILEGCGLRSEEDDGSVSYGIQGGEDTWKACCTTLLLEGGGHGTSKDRLGLDESTTWFEMFSKALPNRPKSITTRYGI
jgi:hypothetical protein